MFLEFLVRFFVRHLSAERCVKLYAALLMSEDHQLTRQAALDKAYFSEPDDLRRKLHKLIEYGPNGPLS